MGGDPHPGGIRGSGIIDLISEPCRREASDITGKMTHIDFSSNPRFFNA